MSFAPSWRACAYLARSEAWRRRHEAEQAQTAGRARRRDCACAARREVFRPSAPLRRRGCIARLTTDARAVAGGAPPKRLIKLSADRMCWAGNAAAVSRARCARSAGWRRTRARTQSSDCGAARGLSKTALIAWRVRLHNRRASGARESSEPSRAQASAERANRAPRAVLRRTSTRPQAESLAFIGMVDW